MSTQDKLTANFEAVHGFLCSFTCTTCNFTFFGMCCLLELYFQLLFFQVTEEVVSQLRTKGIIVNNFF